MLPRGLVFASTLFYNIWQAASQKPPPGGGGGGPGGGGGGGAPQSSSPHAASMLGDVALTTAVGVETRSGLTFSVGENIYGPFEAGFASQQDGILAGLGCNPGSLGHVAGGIDTYTAEQVVAYGCNVVLPRVEGDKYVSLLDECGGHTSEYHFHERLSCLYDGTTGGHSTKVGATTSRTSVYDGLPLYGKWEHTTEGTLPTLDACGAHFGRTPESPNADVYHYHVQEKPPFTIGCFGPNDDGSLVTVEQCRAFYSGCDGNVVVLKTPKGDVTYDDWCPCYDAAGSNAGGNVAEASSGGNVAATNSGGGMVQGNNATGADSPEERAVDVSACPALAALLGVVGIVVIAHWI